MRRPPIYIRNGYKPVVGFALLSMVWLQSYESAAIGATQSDSIEFVIHISVDGLRSDAVTGPGAAILPNFYRLRVEGAFTDNARTDFNYTVTIPNHLCQLTSRPVVGDAGHSITFNDDFGGTVHSRKGEYVHGAFDVIHDYGLQTAMYASKTKFSFMERSWDGTNGAADTAGTDNGRDKIDFTPNITNTQVLIDRFIENMPRFGHNYSFIHLRDPDSAGHASGWGSGPYNDAVQHVDGLLGRIFELIDSDQKLAGKTAIVLTSDHGGTGSGHSSSGTRANYIIPFYVWGPGVPSGMELYQFNPESRADPGVDNPDYSAPLQPIRNGDVGNLAVNMLNLPAIPGSAINVEHDLSFSYEDGRDALPTVAIVTPSEGQVVTNTSVIIEAAAASDSGAITHVEFFSNYEMLGEVAAAPYRFEWLDAPVGMHVITARATDDRGSGNTASVGIEVTTTTFIAPTQPAGFQIYGSYPNPSRQTTRIDFAIARDNQVDIVLYDLRGREITTLVKRQFRTGRHKVPVNFPNLASGIYFYRLRVGSVSQMRKLLIVQ